MITSEKNYYHFDEVKGKNKGRWLLSSSIKFVLKQSDILKVAQSLGLGKIKQEGNKYNCLCPFHKEKTPSFTIFPLSQRFHCYGCGEGGNVLRLVMKLKNKNLIETIIFIKKVCGISGKLEFGIKGVDKIFFNRDLNWRDYIPESQLEPELIEFNDRVDLLLNQNSSNLKEELNKDEYNDFYDEIRNEYNYIYGKTLEYITGNVNEEFVDIMCK